MKCELNKIIKKHNLNLDKNCTNNAEHSDGNNLFCSECWNTVENIYVDSELI